MDQREKINNNNVSESKDHIEEMNNLNVQRQNLDGLQKTDSNFDVSSQNFIKGDLNFESDSIQQNKSTNHFKNETLDQQTKQQQSIE